MVVRARGLGAHVGTCQLRKPANQLRFHNPPAKVMTHTDMHKITLTASSSKEDFFFWGGGSMASLHFTEASIPVGGYWWILYYEVFSSEHRPQLRHGDHRFMLQLFLNGELKPLTNITRDHYSTARQLRQKGTEAAGSET